MDFVPHFQKYSCILSLLNSLILLSLGSFLLLIPQTVVHILLDYDHDDLVEDKEVIFSMTRMASGVLLAQGLSSLLLLLPMLVHDFGKVTPRLISVTTGRTSIEAAYRCLEDDPQKNPVDKTNNDFDNNHHGNNNNDHSD